MTTKELNGILASAIEAMEDILEEGTPEERADAAKLLAEFIELYLDLLPKEYQMQPVK